MEKTKSFNKFAFYGGLVYFVSMLAFFLIKLFAFFGWFNFPYADMIFKVIIQVGVMFVLPIFLFSVFTKSKPKKTFDYFSFKKITGKTVFLSFLMGFCVFVLVFFISSFWSSFLGMFGLKQSSSGGGEYSVTNFLMGLLLTAFLPGVCEETTHRGMLLFSLKKNGAIRAIVLCGLLFGLMHLNIFQFGYAFVVGIIFGAVTLMTKSIFPAMIMHFTNNALSLVWSYSLHSDWMNNRIVDGIINFFENSTFLVSTFVELFVLSLAVWFVYVLFINLFEESKKMKYLRFKKRFLSQIKNSKFETEIDLKNDDQIFQIYRNTQILKIQEQISNQNPLEMANLSTSKTFQFMLGGDFKPPKQPRAKENIFTYLSIALGVVGTILFVVLALVF